MSTNSNVIAIARKYIGRDGTIFRKFAGLDPGQPYCNAYVDYVAYEGGVSKLYFNGRKETYCPHSYSWCKKHLAQVPPYLAMEADIIYFDWEKNGIPNHIGYVTKRISTGVVQTIEGNTSMKKNGKTYYNVVAEKKRTTDYVQAIFRPHFVEAYKIGQISVDGDFGYSSIANLQRALGISVDGILGKRTVKALQKKAGAKADGAWGPATSKKIQKMIGVKDDGDFGPKSVKALQTWINKKNRNNDIPSPEPTPQEPSKQKYQGVFPEIPPKTAKIAVECAYAYGTSPKKYTYKDGKPKEAYKKRLNEAWPNRKGWKYPKSRAGASCDVFVGVVLKCSGYKNAVHAMAKFVPWCKKNLEHVKSPKNGDILTRTNHIMVFVTLKGKGRYANAHYALRGGCYGAIESKHIVGKYDDIWRPKGLSYFSRGDTFTDVKRLKYFLNWYGNYGLKDSYKFGVPTEKAVMDFQEKEGLKVTGKFGPAELAKAKAVRK